MQREFASFSDISDTLKNRTNKERTKRNS